MKEVVVVEPGKVEIREVPVPELANEDEVLIQMKSIMVPIRALHTPESPAMKMPELWQRLEKMSQM